VLIDYSALNTKTVVAVAEVPSLVKFIVVALCDTRLLTCIVLE
jgi:hypothetical protein